MNWLARKAQSVFEGIQVKEINAYIEQLEVLDGSDIGFIVATATDQRHAVEMYYGWDLLDPYTTVAMHPGAAFKIGSLIKERQRNQQYPLATALMVWLHTLRGVNSLKTLGRTRTMWGQLQRGFSHVENAKLNWIAMAGSGLDIHEYDRFPGGMTPDPRP